jgi:hypothetical protein
MSKKMFDFFNLFGEKRSFKYFRFYRVWCKGIHGKVLNSDCPLRAKDQFIKLHKRIQQNQIKTICILEITPEEAIWSTENIYKTDEDNKLKDK